MKNTLILVAVLLLASFSGCNTFKNWFRPKGAEAPSLTLQPAQDLTLEEITSAINRNSMQVRNMSTENGQIMAPGVLIPLQARLAFERPRRLRVQASVAMSGQELDFGSNDMLFWIWTRRLPEKEMYYCRHDQFPTCPVRNVVPIEPDWIVEAIGIIEFLPTDQHEGPIRTDDGQLAIVTRRQTATGQFVKRTVIDAKTGWVLRQEMYSPQNEMVALAILSDHCYDKASGIHYARRVEVKCQGSEGKIILDLGTPVFNRDMPFNSAMFQMPNFDGYRPVDICGPEFLQSRGGVMPMSTYPNTVPNAVPNAVPNGGGGYPNPQPVAPTQNAPVPYSQTMPSAQPAATTYQYPTATPVPGASAQTVIR